MIENERADAGRDGRSCLARPYSEMRTTATGENWSHRSADHKKPDYWWPCPVDVQSAESDKQQQSGAGQAAAETSPTKIDLLEGGSSTIIDI